MVAELSFVMHCFEFSILGVVICSQPMVVVVVWVLVGDDLMESARLSDVSGVVGSVRFPLVSASDRPAGLGSSRTTVVATASASVVDALRTAPSCPALWSFGDVGSAQAVCGCSEKIPYYPHTLFVVGDSQVLVLGCY